MSDFNRNGEEMWDHRSLDNAVVVLLPDILASLPSEIARSVSDHAYDQIKLMGARVSLETILTKKYAWLVEHEQITPFTPQQIQQANQQKMAA